MAAATAMTRAVHVDRRSLGSARRLPPMPGSTTAGFAALACVGARRPATRRSDHDDLRRSGAVGSGRAADVREVTGVDPTPDAGRDAGCDARSVTRVAPTPVRLVAPPAEGSRGSPAGRGTTGAFVALVRSTCSRSAGASIARSASATDGSVIDATVRSKQESESEANGCNILTAVAIDAAGGTFVVRRARRSTVAPSIPAPTADELMAARPPGRRWRRPSPGTSAPGRPSVQHSPRVSIRSGGPTRSRRGPSAHGSCPRCRLAPSTTR